MFIAVAVIFMMATSAYGQYRLVNAFPLLSFNSPVGFNFALDGTNLAYVTEQAGKVKVFLNDSNSASSNVFLDVTAKISSGGERGLLGLAFHPNYLSNRYFYIYYTNLNGDVEISRYTRSLGNPLAADTNSRLILLTIPHPGFSNHNGGSLFFGLDGYLYAGVGDGGSAGDPNNNAQNTNVLLGKLLRLDVNNPSGGNNYGIPPGNPFISGGGRAEIYSYGLRNPWRVSQDAGTSIIYAGDVGQDVYEEIDIINGGGNYGWRIMEGFHCYNPPTGCDTTGLKKPIKEYIHGGNGCSVTGGYVYRGSRMPDLLGCYIYGDYCSANIWKLKYENGIVTQDQLVLGTALSFASLSSFGVDQNNELLVCKVSPPGAIYRLDREAIGIETGTTTAYDFALSQNYPNPYNPSTKIGFSVGSSSPAGYTSVELKVYDAAGKEINTLVNNNLKAGNYEVRWEASAVPSGVYFYVLTAGDKRISRKMVLIK